LGSRQWEQWGWAALWDWGRELTIGYTRGEVVSLIVPASEFMGALSQWLRRLPLQHIDDVHTVNTLQSRVQALHCRENAQTSESSMQGKRDGEVSRSCNNVTHWMKEVETQKNVG